MTKKEKIIEMIEDTLSDFRNKIDYTNEDDKDFYLDAIDKALKNETYNEYIDAIDKCLSGDVYNYRFDVRIEDEDKIILTVATTDVTSAKLFEEIIN